MIQDWEPTLRTLADDPSAYEREGGTILFTRQGVEYAITLSEAPGAGLCVELGNKTLVPISTYIQRDILGLPRLAKQIVTISERASISKNRPVSFVEGPATLEIDKTIERWKAASQSLRAFLKVAEPGTTRLVELMAPAGRGKTMLLETISREFAIGYQPEPFPSPLLLKVDLLGRYVGTIDDAIAGSLNNEYYFPGLSQKDVALAVKRRWLVLALDGFDELVARVGSRDAFMRITELLDQLEGQGTVLLSARESFFELYQVAAAIKTYLQPRRGNYVTSVVRLERWARIQGEEVFQKLHSSDPPGDFSGLAATFEDDAELIYHPFFLTQLAQLWMAGERFAQAAGQATSLARTKYVIETFVNREANEKWIDRDSNPLITPEAHLHLLSGIAEEMWRSGAFALEVDELRLAAQLGAEHLQLSKPIMDAALERVPTHAALSHKDRKGTSFLHDRFLHYFLAIRIVHLLKSRDISALRHLFTARELVPDASEWIAWHWRNTAGRLRPTIEALQQLSEENSTARLNASELAARILDSQSTPLGLTGFEFVGEACRGRRYENVSLQKCNFWHADLSGGAFINCSFGDCGFGDLQIDDLTQFGGSRLERGTISSIQSGDEKCFAPREIDDMLREHGMVVPAPDDAHKLVEEEVRPVHPSRVKSIEALIRASTKTWDVLVEELEHSSDRGELRKVVRMAIKCDVLKEVTKETSGRQKTWVRLVVDREKLSQGLRGATGDARIDAFWSAMENK